MRWVLCCPVNLIWKTLSPNEGSIFSPWLVTCPGHWDALPHFKVILSCLVWSGPEPALSAWALLCRAVLLSPAGWAELRPWGSAPPAPCSSWPYLSWLLFKGTASQSLPGERAKTICVSNCSKIWLPASFHRKKKCLLNRVLQEGLVSAGAVGRLPCVTGNVES